MKDASGSSLPTAQMLREALQVCPLIAVLRWIGPEDVESVAEILVAHSIR
jgi:hypothetical protein